MIAEFLAPQPTVPKKGCRLSYDNMPLPLDDKTPWIIEHSFDGWRLVVDTTTKRCYNHSGKRMPDGSLFRVAIYELSSMFPDEMIDCKALGGEYRAGVGSLVALDRMVDGNYFKRTDPIRLVFPALTLMTKPENDKVYSSHVYDVSSVTHSIEPMKRWNRELKCTLYNGVVAKRTDTEYIHGNTDTWIQFNFNS